MTETISLSWQNGYCDALDGQLFDDSEEFNKDGYAAGFSAGKEQIDQEDFLSPNAMQDLIHGTTNSIHFASFADWLRRKRH